MENDQDRELEASVVAALTDGRVRWKHLVLADRSANITGDALDAYGKFGWEIASVSEVLQTDQWGTSYYFTTVIFKMPWQHAQEYDPNGQS